MNNIAVIEIDHNQDIVISRQALELVNQRLANILELIGSNTGYLNSTYEQDFNEIESWIKAHIPAEGQQS